MYIYGFGRHLNQSNTLPSLQGASPFINNSTLQTFNNSNSNMLGSRIMNYPSVTPNWVSSNAAIRQSPLFTDTFPTSTNQTNSIVSVLGSGQGQYLRPNTIANSKPPLEQYADNILNSFAAAGEWWGNFKRQDGTESLAFVDPIGNLSEYRQDFSQNVFGVKPSWISSATSRGASFLNALTSSLDVAEVFAKDHAAGNNYADTNKAIINSVGKTTTSGIAGKLAFGAAMAGGAALGLSTSAIWVPAAAIGLGSAYLGGKIYDLGSSWLFGN